jgi:hypothetical protein
MRNIQIDFKKGFISSIILMLFSVVTWADNAPTGFLSDWENAHGRSLGINNNEVRTNTNTIKLEGFYAHATKGDNAYQPHFQNMGNNSGQSPKVVSR